MLSPVPDNETETGKQSPPLEKPEAKSPTRVKTQGPLILSIGQLDGGNEDEQNLSPPVGAPDNVFTRSRDSGADSSSSVGSRFNRMTLEQDIQERRESNPSALSKQSHFEVQKPGEPILLLGDLVLSVDKGSSKNRSDSKDDQKDLENPHSSHHSMHEMQLGYGEEEKNSK